MEKITASVHDIVNFFFAEGDIFLTGPSGPLMEEGTVRHTQIQKAAPEGYIAEFPVECSIDGEYVELVVKGRIDGILPGKNGILLEEIKTTGTPLELLNEETRPDHWAQAKIYAAMLIFAASDSPEGLPFPCELLDRDIVISLCYFNRGSQDIRRLEQTADKKELVSFFECITEGYLEWAESIGQWHQRKTRSLPEVEFPFPSFRKGQELLCEEAGEAVKERKHLYIHAPTGIGKTAGVLYPAVKSLQARPDRKIFYLTAKSSGKETAEKTLEIMREGGLELKSLTLTAKSRICFILDEFGGDSPPCDPEICEYAKGHYRRVKDALKASFDEPNLSRELIEAYAREYRVCPFEFSLDAALTADVIICDYNYVFDPRVRLIRFFKKAGDYIFLIDEVHNLIDRGRNIFSASVEKREVLQLKRIQKDSNPAMSKLLGHINGLFISIGKAVPGNAWFSDYPDELKHYLGEWIQMFEWALKHKRRLESEAYDFYYNAIAFVRVLNQYNAAYRTLVSNTKRNLVITLSCIDPGEFLLKGIKLSKSSLMFTATLSPVDYHTELISCGEGAVLELDSPFPRENRIILADTSISTKYRDRQRTAPLIADRIACCVQASKGKYMAFFPSYAYLQLVEGCLKDDYPGLFRIETQTKGMGDEERKDFLGLFDEEYDTSLLVLGVMGGLFSEGIDLKGDKLKGAIIVGVGLPQIGPDRDIIKMYFNEKSGKGFEYAYTYPGFSKVLQAAGRVIRTEEDTGVILYIGSRFGEPRYMDLFPDHMKPDMYVRSKEQIEDALSEFWVESSR